MDFYALRRCNIRWFKNFTDNHRGRTVQTLLNEVGPGGALAYYIIMEMCAEKLIKRPGESIKESDCVFTFNSRFLAAATRLRPATIDRVADICRQAGVMKLTVNENEIVIEVPILLDLLDRDLKGSRSRRAQDAPKPRLELDKELDKELELESTKVLSPTQPKEVVRVGCIPEFEFNSSCKIWLQGVKQQTQYNWIKLYNDPEYFRREFLKMENWLRANNAKASRSPRGWSQFISGWLDRNWEKYRKTLQSNPSANKSMAEILAERDEELERRRIGRNE